MEFKNSQQFTTQIDDRKVSGIASVFGNEDHGEDMVWPGAFLKTITERGSSVKHLWNHGQDGWDYFCTPPIAQIKELKEIGRADLPPIVLQRAPAATGGLLVIREYLDTPRGNEVLAALAADVPLEMSFGFDVIKWDFETVNAGQPTEYRRRNLRELRLWDTSDVNFGMNSATTAAGKGSQQINLLLERAERFVRDFGNGKKELAAPLLKLRSLLAGLKLEQQPGLPASRADWKQSLTPMQDQLKELELSLR